MSDELEKMSGEDLERISNPTICYDADCPTARCKVHKEILRRLKRGEAIEKAHQEISKVIKRGDLFVKAKLSLIENVFAALDEGKEKKDDSPITKERGFDNV